MDRVRPAHGVPVEAVTGQAPYRFISGTDIDRPAGLRGDHPEDLANVLRQLAELLFTRLQGLLALLALGDIQAQADVPKKLASRG